jgi:GrpB-like predicted nucleotidyltransferase (UPF0157 family)
VGIEVRAYDDRWPVQFEEERATLERALAPWLAAGVHHIGSTAVPGLAAKPILDMIAGVTDLKTASGAVPAVVALGYIQGEHRPHEALWFSKAAPKDPVRATHALHLTEVGTSLWQERIAFRDALRADPELVREYAALKIRLAAVHTDVPAYTRDKREFVARVLETAGVRLGG